MCVQPNIDERSCNHCESGKTICITYCECVFVALVIHHAMRMCRTFVCGLPRSFIFFHIFSYAARFWKKNFIEQKMRVLIFSTTLV